MSGRLHQRLFQVPREIHLTTRVHPLLAIGLVPTGLIKLTAVTDLQMSLRMRGFD